ncbi:hypothetical protein HZP42_05640 [Elizabethkingia anophelis]|uniref:hypothetical protein n=1 Tax=Elizabethkingia anophelis TaxID=1117645 RepID=UPI003892999A|nr:hypothetical protein [Elizabethkingia anophelis]
MNPERYLEEDFGGFLKELLDIGIFADGKDIGIARLAKDKGFDSLSEKQKFALKNAINEHVYNECKRCGCDIPWGEMHAASDNGGLCSWCQQLGRNDKD